MHRHELAVLSALKEAKKLSFKALLDKAGLGADEATWAIANLAQAGLVTATKTGTYEVGISEEGEKYARSSLPEMHLLKKLGAGSVELNALESKEDQIAFSWAKRKGLVEISGRALRLTPQGKIAAKEGMATDVLLKELYKDKSVYPKRRESEEAKELEQRKLIEVRAHENIKEVAITTQGVLSLARERQTEQMIESLDRSMIKTRAWAGKKFRPYNVEAKLEPADAVAHHPLLRLIDEIKEAYVGLGFSEISGPVVQPSFWVFDYLFMPQDHPARDAQDTFFLKNPSELSIKDKKLVERVKEAHEGAWHGEWSEKLAMQAVPRTQMTSVTGMYINEILTKMEAGAKYELPRKFFTIGRTFRNENLDFKHLADFYQTDGIVIGKGLTLANLFDILIRLYGSLGIKVGFKPAYFPFVEPGVEVFGELNGKQIELCGAGIIRKEVTGVKRSSLNVLAWGGGVERMLLLRDDSVKSITELFGASAGWLRGRKVV